MKTISNIKQEYARNMGYVDWNEILDSIDIPVELEVHYDRLLVMVAREALKNAAENVEIGWKINKQSILSDKNIPEL